MVVNKDEDSSCTGFDYGGHGFPHDMDVFAEH